MTFQAKAIHVVLCSTISAEEASQLTPELLVYHLNIEQAKREEWNQFVEAIINVEIYKVLHGNRHPDFSHASYRHALDFLLRLREDVDFAFDIQERSDWKILVSTAKRIVFRFASDILTEISS